MLDVEAGRMRQRMWDTAELSLGPKSEKYILPAGTPIRPLLCSMIPTGSV